MANLALNGANTTAGNITIGAVGRTVETLNVSATGANRLGTVSDQNSVTTYNIAGAGSVNATLAGTAITTVNAADNTGGVTLNTTASAGNTQTITGGTGNDTITTTYLGLSAQDTINLGDGTDSLLFTDAATFNDAATAARLSKVSNVEKLGTVSALLTVDGDLVSQNTFTTNGAAGDFAITNAANNTTLEFGAGAVLASEAAMKLGANTLNVELNGSTTAAADVTNGLTVTGSTTVNVESNGTAGVAQNVLLLNAADNQNVVITGSQDLTLTTSNASSTTGFTIDGSAATGKLNITGTGSADTITGGSGNDIIAGGAGANTLTGGAGNDTFGVANATINATTFNGTTITDFNTGDNKLDFAGAAGVSTNYSEASSAVADFAAAYAAANTALDTTILYNAQQVGSDTYVFYSADGDLGAGVDDSVVKLTGVSLAEIEFADIVA